MAIIKLEGDNEVRVKFLSMGTAEEVQGNEQISTDEKKDTEVEKTKTKRIAEETLLQESFKKLRTDEASRSEPIQEQPTEEPKELSKEELKKMLEMVPVEEIKAEALQAYQVFEDMLKRFDREYLVTLWSLVKERFRSAEPTKDKERALWVELKRLFEPDKDDVLWKLQRYMYDPLTWRLYDTCGVHHVSSTRVHRTFFYVDRKGLSIINCSYEFDAKYKAASKRR
ncbi:hypothetical protein Tco_1219995 [Tanacetum coccineum]